MIVDYYVFGAGHEGTVQTREHDVESIKLISAPLVRSGSDRFKDGEFAEYAEFPVKKVMLRGVIYSVASDEEITPERLRKALINRGRTDLF